MGTQQNSEYFCDITPWKSTDISEQHVASTFSAEEYAKQETSMMQTASRASKSNSPYDFQCIYHTPTTLTEIC
jgi:hypothetical protein